MANRRDGIGVMDLGGQYAHLIATKIRRQGVFAEIVRPESSVEDISGFKGLVLSGSPALASRGQGRDYNQRVFELAIPVLGICFGHQEIARHYGGRVEHTGREWGPSKLHVVEPHPLFDGVPGCSTVWMSHFDTVVELPVGFKEIGVTVEGDRMHRNAAIADDSRRRYGFQFHPEVDDSEHGEVMLRNFAVRVCGCPRTWNVQTYIQGILDRIVSTVGDRPVFMLVSGGVDSTVAAVLLARAVGPDRLRLLHVDNGFMRLRESAEVLGVLRDLGLGRSLRFVDASEDFLEATSGLCDPEEKRQAIGETFVRVFEREARRLCVEQCVLGQGTIYPDTIETGGTTRAQVIKTHHNRVEAIERLIKAGKVVEPLRELYKAEVRELGALLGLPKGVLERHPFPGPGLAIRCICHDGSTQDIGALQQSVASRAGNVLALVMPVRSVGVKADIRVYEYPVLLHEPGFSSLEDAIPIARDILQGVEGINRCVVDLGGRPPGALVPVRAGLTKERLDLLRRADAFVGRELAAAGLWEGLWQCPVVLVPVTTAHGSQREYLVLRPVLSERGMTARPALLPLDFLRELASSLCERLPSLWGVGIDVTPKPPATIEWE